MCNGSRQQFNRGRRQRRVNGQGGEIIIQMKGVQMCEVIIDFGLELRATEVCGFWSGLEDVVQMNGVKLSEEIINFCLDKEFRGDSMRIRNGNKLRGVNAQFFPPPS